MRRSPIFWILACAAGIVIGAGPKSPAGSVDSIGIKLVRIEPGTFLMGNESPLPEELLSNTAGVMSKRPAGGDYDEAPAHRVTIAHPFLMGETEVTIDQFRRFRPEYRGNPEYAPYASGVSWRDAMAFAKWLSAKEGAPYRLPTEAEWEYACRAGTRTPFSSGNEPPAPGTPNPWGLKNMHTGVAEWTLDWHGLYPAAPATDPVGPAFGIAKVVRGGGLDYRKTKTGGSQRYPAGLPYFARSANRASIAPDFASPSGNIGFRIVEAPLPKSAPLAYQIPFVQTAVKQTAIDTARGPDPSKPYYHTRPLFPNLGDRSMRAVGWKIGLAPGLGVAYHNSAVVVCPNGDLLAAYYDSPAAEDDPDQTILIMRLRYGSEQWDMPEPWPDFADADDAAPVFWNDRGKLWMFWGSPRLLGGPPFQYMTSLDNGATWSPVEFPALHGPVGKFTPQPINSVVRGRDGTIFLPVDGSGGHSVLFATHDDGKSWYDTGGRTGGRHTTVVLAKDGSLIGFGGKNTNIDGFMPVSVSRDGGKTYQITRTQFSPLGSGQRPSVIRLASGRLFFVADSYPAKKPAPKRPGAYVALSGDDGATWQTRTLPGIATVGYVTATQGPNGIIHVVTSKNKPNLNIDLNEAWVLEGGAEMPAAAGVGDAKSYRERYPDGKTKATWSAGIAGDGNYRLQGRQIFYYENGRKQWEASFAAGRKTGLETYWRPDGRKQWERAYAPDGTWSWRIFNRAGHLKADSRWKGKDLIEVLP
ncbi:MAG: SUMF1/EgtB/PvdO family nonheme iron enzyme [Pseudomonadota bacterium]